MNTEPASTSAHRSTPSRSTSSSDHAEHSRKPGDVRSDKDAKDFRKIMKRGGKQGLLQQPRGEQPGQQGTAGEGFSGQHHDQRDGDGSLTAGMLALQQAQVTLHQNMVQPTTTTMTNMAPALAELISRHVKQLLVPDASSRGTRSREIMITLKDDILPGTELWLSRTANGWRLRADTRSPDAYRMLTEQAPGLIERFASQRLGQLEIDPALID